MTGNVGLLFLIVRARNYSPPRSVHGEGTMCEINEDDTEGGRESRSL